ncbi:MAG: ABC transporter substrate-binding protein, partial [Planctomycetota bacterium]
MRSICFTVLFGLALLAVTACGPSEPSNPGENSTAGTATTNSTSGDPSPTGPPKVLQIPMRVGSPQTLDPVLGSTVYENRACAQTYETLLQHQYLVRPPALEPLLLSKMPEVSDDGMIWKFELKPGVHFHDDACFPGGKGREITSDDVFYSFRRFADPAYRYKNWWLVEKTIRGFDEYKEQQAEGTKAGKSFDYDAPVEGLVKVDDRRFEIH